MLPSETIGFIHIKTRALDVRDCSLAKFRLKEDLNTKGRERGVLCGLRLNVLLREPL